MNKPTVFCPECGALVPILEVVSSEEVTFGRRVRAEVGCVHGRLTFIGSNQWSAKEREDAR